MNVKNDFAGGVYTTSPSVTTGDPWVPHTDNKDTLKNSSKHDVGCYGDLSSHSGDSSRTKPLQVQELPYHVDQVLGGLQLHHILQEGCVLGGRESQAAGPREGGLQNTPCKY